MRSVGSYYNEWTVTTCDDNFVSGLYQVVIYICDGDCGGLHPYSGVISKTVVNFTVL